jgi:predicted PurR-regulated permease PerM
MQSFFAKALESTNFWRYLVIILIGGYYGFALIYSISGILSPFITGFIGAYIFSGPVRKLEGYKIPRGVSSAFIILTLLVIIAILGGVAIPHLQKELILLAQNLPKLAQRIYSTLEPFVYSLSSVKIGGLDFSLLGIEFSQYINFIVQWIIKLMIDMLSGGMAVANLVIFIALTPLIMFYILKDWPRLFKTLDNLLPCSCRESWRLVFRNIHNTLSSYVQGQALVCVILMLLYSLGLSLVGLKQALFIGILSGFSAFIPYLGMLIGLLCSLIAAFEQFHDNYSIFMTVVIYLSIYLLDGNLLAPQLIGGKIGLHPLWILFALLVGGIWFGFLGIILAIPAAAVIGAIVRTLLELHNRGDSLPLSRLINHG